MHTNNILFPEQFCFRQGKSTENAHFKLTDSVVKSVNQKMHVDGIFCDVAEAFDCVNHEILIVKLYYYGLCWHQNLQQSSMKCQKSYE
jgi:hypothetical protein